jgi:hypothetical protein
MIPWGEIFLSGGDSEDSLEDPLEEESDSLEEKNRS